MKALAIMLALTAALIWFTRSLGDPAASDGDIVAATRGPAAPAAKAPPGKAAYRANPAGPSPAAPAAPATPAPLFRLAQAPAPPQQPRPQAGETFRLVGLFSRGGAQVAMLKDDVDGRIWNAAAGGAVAGWTVRGIEGPCATLVRGRRTVNVCM